ncbi:hypothetical protein [Asticcacaulis sp. YBE204]|uniref:hypothetical protein n=1 Tax=Asticcacaulis sp. YBE204 TaxID=1282363 RepID=UPI0003C3BCFC|nr:hypothetical protein [Asticcacaulis sp. YBE204]ESQ79132.1 hypothetical protein AEYBE204_10620 [Asticcacaulis sp. YBE204]
MTDTPDPDAEDVSRTAEDQKKKDGADPFPPEGTDENAVKPGANTPLSEAERLKATKAVISHDQAAAPK